MDLGRYGHGRISDGVHVLVTKSISNSCCADNEKLSLPPVLTISQVEELVCDTEKWRRGSFLLAVRRDIIDQHNILPQLLEKHVPNLCASVNATADSDQNLQSSFQGVTSLVSGSPPVGTTSEKFDNF